MLKHHPDSPALAPNLVSRIRHGLHRFLTLELQRRGLSGLVPSHGLILGCLYCENHVPMHRLARLIGRRKSTLTVLADKLENRGYLRREVSSGDCRVRQLALTEKGEEARTAFEEISEAMQNRLWRGFSEEEKRQTMMLLRRLSDNISAGEPDGSDDDALKESC